MKTLQRPVIFAGFFIPFLVQCTSTKFSNDMITDITALLKEGKEQFESINANAALSPYGSCWTSAVTNLEEGCRSLTQESQSVLALHLTDCFLQMAGQGGIKCDFSRKDCLQSLNDRQFNAYTDFFTHSQNICYFLQSKIWHEQTELTIDKLASTSLKVSLQLAAAERGQAALLDQQRVTLDMQEALSRNVHSSKDTISALMRQLHDSTIEQKLALGSLFNQLSSLQNWVQGELSWIDSVLFYSISAILSCIFTSVLRTRRARLPILVILSVNYGIERWLTSYLISDGESESIALLNLRLTEWVWCLRKIAVFFSISVLITTYFTYCNYEQLNYELLLKIVRQNSEISRFFKGNHPFDTVDQGTKTENSDSVNVAELRKNLLDVKAAKGLEAVAQLSARVLEKTVTVSETPKRHFLRRSQRLNKELTPVSSV